MTSEGNQWPVVIFRKTANGFSKMTDKANPWKAAVVNISPKQGCILAHKLRLRVKVSINDNAKHTSTISRRKDKLIVSLSSPQHQRIFVFQFKSVSSCVAFANLFVEQNPPASAESTRLKERLNDDQLNAQRRDVMSYVARLLHDDDFLTYVNGLEAALMSSEDGRQMLQTLQKRSH